MINILIITDDLYYWMGKIQNNCYVDSRTFNKYCCTIYTDMFVFEQKDTAIPLTLDGGLR